MKSEAFLSLPQVFSLNDYHSWLLASKNEVIGVTPAHPSVVSCIRVTRNSNLVADTLQCFQFVEAASLAVRQVTELALMKHMDQNHMDQNHMDQNHMDQNHMNGEAVPTNTSRKGNTENSSVLIYTSTTTSTQRIREKGSCRGEGSPVIRLAAILPEWCFKDVTKSRSQVIEISESIFIETRFFTHTTFVKEVRRTTRLGLGFGFDFVFCFHDPKKLGLIEKVRTELTVSGQDSALWLVFCDGETNVSKTKGIFDFILIGNVQSKIAICNQLILWSSLISWVLGSIDFSNPTLEEPSKNIKLF